jgi:superfamily II DNA/RNA helicase
MNTFAELGISGSLVASLNKAGITSPTAIQCAAIPQALSGTDVLASAPTGTGKTLAYSLPLLVRIQENSGKKALILVPTRELAMQIFNNLKLFVTKEINFSLLIGGEPMGFQQRKLRENPNVIIGTPGRINAHLRDRTLKLDKTAFLVLDETDRMLDMGFEEQLEDIVKHLPTERQTMMFSATFPHNIMSLSKQYLNNPKEIRLTSEQQAKPNIKQDVIRTSVAEKFTNLKKALDGSEGSVLIFVKTKVGAEDLAGKLCEFDYSASFMHGDLRQQARTRAIANFRRQSTRIMVATDVAARGLDIPHIRFVINYDLPQCKEDYIHRIGRTGRAGAEGISLCLLTPSDNKKWSAISSMIKGGSETFELDERSPYSSGNRRSNNSTRPPRFIKNEDGARREGSRSSRPSRDFDSRSPREGSNKVVREWDNKPQRDFARPSRDFDSRSPREGSNKVVREWDNKPQRDSAKPSRDFDSRSPREGSNKVVREWDNKPQRDFAKPSRDFDSRSPREGSNKIVREWDNKPQRDFARPSRDFDSRSAREGTNKLVRELDNKPREVLARPLREGDSRPARTNKDRWSFNKKRSSSLSRTRPA